MGSHVKRRGPVGTPPMGTASASGSRAIDATISPPRLRTVTSLAKRRAPTSREKGRSTSTVSRCSPFGEALTCSYRPGRPMAVRRPVARSMAATWLVK